MALSDAAVNSLPFGDLPTVTSITAGTNGRAPLEMSWLTFRVQRMKTRNAPGS